MDAAHVGSYALDASTEKRQGHEGFHPRVRQASPSSRPTPTTTSRASTCSVVLHELYFGCLGGNGQAGASERLAFGSFDAWETEFRRIGAGLGGSSGWVVLGFNQHTRPLENY